MNNKALISAVGISLALLLTNTVNNETEYLDAVLQNEAIKNSEDFQKLYKEKAAECDKVNTGKEFDKVVSRQDCKLDAKLETLNELKGRSHKVK
jgi:hypothetical protein